MTTYYKGFDQDLRCRSFRYELGKTYREDTADLCSSGFHACELPQDVFAYYAPGDSRFCEVELEEVSEKTDSDSKRVGKVIKIRAEIGIVGICKAAVKVFFEKANFESRLAKAKKSKKNSAGVSGAAAAGESGAASAGDSGAAVVLDYGKAEVAENGVACGAGDGTRVRGELGALLVLASRSDNGGFAEAVARVVDGERVKPGVWYALRNGEFVEFSEKEEE